MLCRFYLLPTNSSGRDCINLFICTYRLIGQYLDLRNSSGLHPDYGYPCINFYWFTLVVRTVQPVLSDIETELEEAASALDCKSRQTITKIILPILFPCTINRLCFGILPAVLVNMVLLFLLQGINPV